MLAIRNVRPILTAPYGVDLVIVKVETSEPELYGLGCATFTQRCLAVQTVVSEYLEPLLAGRDADRIEELFQLMMLSGYWRNGPVLNNAISGVDMALWDIKAKQAGMPLYDLLGGKFREAAAVYRHAGGDSPDAVEAEVRGYIDQGVRHVRVQMGGYGARSEVIRPEGSRDGSYYDPRMYMNDTIRLLEHLRGKVGFEVELLHDVHERLDPALAVQFAKELESFRLYFLEDLLAPEDLDWFANVRSVCTTPLAMGELFNHPREWTPLIAGRFIDFMRMHISQMGGLTPARKVAAMGEMYGVRTAWHGPGDLSPVGQALNLHLDLVCPNFGIQEYFAFSEQTREVFPGSPELRDGYLYPNGKPGLGVDLDEKSAARHPCRLQRPVWTEARLPDGSLHRP